MTHNTKIREGFLEVLSSRPKANNFIQQLEENTELLLFGGCVRDYFEHSYKIIPRDFDIVVWNYDDFSLEKFVENFDCLYKANKFGGYKLFLEDLTFDIWEIHQTWAFKEQKVEYNSFKDLNKTVFLNIDSIFYNLNSCELYNEEFIKAFRNKELDIILDDNPFPELNLTRAFRYQTKYNMNFSEQLNKFFVNWLIEHEDPLGAINDLRSIELKRYKTSTINWTYVYNQSIGKELKTPSLI
jgi:hypothetical protein